LARTRKILWPKDYLRFRLTAEACTDLTEPGGAVLLDWERRAYAKERLALVGLEAGVLPPILPANGSGGSILPEVARSLGLSQDVQIVVGMGDVAALYGAAPPKAGRITCSMGSSSMIFTPLAAGQKVQDSAHRIHVYPFGPYPMVGGVSSTTGSSLVWVYEKVCRGKELGSSFEEIAAQALEIEPGAAGLCFVPYLAGERNPYWSDTIRGGFYGLQLTHDYRHLVRAVMEGVAYSLRHLVGICEESGVPIQEIALAGGGATIPGMPQIVADVCGRDVLIYSEQETVTRVLYALCQEHLGRGDFEGSLLQTFDEPSVIRHRRESAGAYNEGYRWYSAFAEFAYERANAMLKGNAQTTL
jgi:xylulokinase